MIVGFSTLQGFFFSFHIKLTVFSDGAVVTLGHYFQILLQSRAERTLLLCIHSTENSSTHISETSTQLHLLVFAQPGAGAQMHQQMN